MYILENSIPSNVGLLFSFLLMTGCTNTPWYIYKNQCVIVKIEKDKVIDPVKFTGVVEPESEVLIRCIYPGTIKEIIKKPGSSVLPGDLILVLDDQQINSENEYIQDQLALKKNSLEKNNLAESSVSLFQIMDAYAI